MSLMSTPPVVRRRPSGLQEVLSPVDDVTLGLARSWLSEEDREAKRACVPVWFGAPQRPLLGWIHRPPAGCARGAVVLCPPLGAELNGSQYVFRVLARELAQAGLLTIRFDYDGTGQSAGRLNDPGRVDAWTGSIEKAAELASGEGVRWIAGIGLRLGATLLMHAATTRPQFDALVLWDPHLSGKTFLREQVAMALAHPNVSGSAEPGEVPGYIVGPPTIEELMRLELPVDLRPAQARVLALLDPMRPHNARIRRRLAGEPVEWQEHCEPKSVFDKGRLHFDLPTGIMNQLTEWLSGACPDAPVPLSPCRYRPREAVVGLTPDRQPITEEVLEIGSGKLFGIACRGCPGRSRSDAPTLIFLSTAAESSVGPGRQWVELSRAWAQRGFQSLRFDLSGIGDSPPRADAPERVIYPPAAIDDILDAAGAVSPSNPRNVVLIGISSGGYWALAAGAEIRPRGIVAINPIFGSTSRDGSTEGRGRWLGTSSLLERGWGVRRRVASWVAPSVWGILFRMSPGRSPACLLDSVGEQGVPTSVLSGAYEAELPLRRTPAAVRRFAAGARNSFMVVPGLDHSLMDAGSRDLAREVISELLSKLAEPQDCGAES